LLLLTVLIYGFISCVDQNKESDNSIFKNNDLVTESTIDFNLVYLLNESNQKVTEITSYIFNQTKDVKTMQLLLKIKKNQKNIAAELKKLSQKNLIIIPKSIYNLNLIPSKSKPQKLYNSNFDLLETEIKKQIKIFDSINVTTRNSDFKQFAIKSIPKLNLNLQTLEFTY
jgi:hypothetical protein